MFTLYIYLPVYIIAISCAICGSWILAITATCICILHLYWVLPDFLRGASKNAQIVEGSQLRVFSSNLLMVNQNRAGILLEIQKNTILMSSSYRNTLIHGTPPSNTTTSPTPIPTPNTTSETIHLALQYIRDFLSTTPPSGSPKKSRSHRRKCVSLVGEKFSSCLYTPFHHAPWSIPHGVMLKCTILLNLFPILRNRYWWLEILMERNTTRG